MAGRRAALDGARGGDRIPTLRAARARLAAALLAFALGASLAAYPALIAHRAVEAVGLLGAAGAAAVVLTLLGSSKLLPLPLLLLAAQLELHDVLEPLPRIVIPVYAAGLLLLGELISWSLGLRAVTEIDRAVAIARIRVLLAT
ncbi:MAG TPA: hypothetical protein VLN26_07030, partial [Gaiellaceae bacterium]|nr:hypothetical protein [Gaiellaceae bacterium]